MSEPMKVQSIPTTQVIGYWEHEKDGYPDRVKVTMADGRKVFYVIETPIPKPHVLKPSEMPEIMRGHIYGGYQGKHIKKGR